MEKHIQRLKLLIVQNSDHILILACGIKPSASEKHQCNTKETEYLINSNNYA